MITVTIPVGPNPSNRKWLDECIDSCYSQTHVPDEILLIDDGANLDEDDFPSGITIWKTPWQSGVAHSFNFGVGLAKNELVFLLGSDDYLAGKCLERHIEAWRSNQKKDAYYWTSIEYIDEEGVLTGKQQAMPCGIAMVTKNLWKILGGFPVMSAVGAPDKALIGLMMKKFSRYLQPVDISVPLCFYREHHETDTMYARRTGRMAIADNVCEYVLNNWKNGSVR